MSFSMLDAALDYAERGWPVFPLIPRGKVPLVAKADGGNGCLDATTRPELIEAWWGAEPNANLGLRCSEFVVVDVDPRHGGHVALARLESQHGQLPPTVRARTGADGEHVLFMTPRVQLRGKVEHGIDLKSAGGYIVAPPSIHPCGGRYAWQLAPSTTPIAPMPHWLLRLARVQSTPVAAPPWRPLELATDRVARAARYAARLEPAISGQHGHDRTFVVCLKVADGFGLNEDEAFEALREWNAACDPPWSEPELRRKIRHAIERGKHRGCLVERRAG